jgi:predicted  nucleic acid-binding Zn-ribbon protein
VSDTARALYRLQLLDSELAEQLSRLREAEALIGESAELRKARRALKKANSELDTCSTRLRSLEMDLRAVNERIQSTGERLYGGRVTNPKELFGLQQDLQYSKRSRENLEDEALAAMVLLEECEEAVSQATDRLARVEKTWHGQQEAISQRIQQLQTEVSELQEQRSSAAGALRARDLALYQDLRLKKGGHAVVLLKDGMCQGCRVSVSTSMVQLVRRGGELVTCTNCGRILATEL